MKQRLPLASSGACKTFVQFAQTVSSQGSVGRVRVLPPGTRPPRRPARSRHRRPATSQPHRGMPKDCPRVASQRVSPCGPRYHALGAFHAPRQNLIHAGMRADSAASSARIRTRDRPGRALRDRAKPRSSSRLATGCSATKIGQNAPPRRSDSIRYHARRRLTTRRNVSRRFPLAEDKSCDARSKEPARPGQNLEKLHLHRRIGHVVFAPDDMGDFLLDVVTTDGNV